jgi:ElaB/YqjD/DUF883 family membrane-anchored ribosome-binding protein
MDKIHGETSMHARNGGVESHMELRAGGRGGYGPDAGERIGEFADRAGDFVDRVRDTVGTRARDAVSSLDDRTGVSALIRENPLAAVGIAFAAGLTIAAISEAKEGHWVIERTRRQLRSALLSGLAAVAARELRGIIGEDGVVELLGSFFDSGDDDYDL